MSTNKAVIKNEISNLIKEAGEIKEEMLRITMTAQSEDWTIEKWKSERSELEIRMNKINSRLKLLYVKLNA